MQTTDRLLDQLAKIPSKFDERYADNWQRKSRETEEATGGLCCYPGCFLKGCEAHHAAYRDKEGPVKGREIPGVHVFWLCDRHHGRRSEDGAHHENNWSEGILPPPTLDSGQKPDYYLKLRKGFVEKQEWVKRIIEAEPDYKFKTRKNGFRNRRNNKPCGRGKDGKQKRNSKTGSSTS